MYLKLLMRFKKGFGLGLLMFAHVTWYILWMLWLVRVKIT